MSFCPAQHFLVVPSQQHLQGSDRIENMHHGNLLRACVCPQAFHSPFPGPHPNIQFVAQPAAVQQAGQVSHLTRDVAYDKSLVCWKSPQVNLKIEASKQQFISSLRLSKHQTSQRPEHDQSPNQKQGRALSIQDTNSALIKAQHKDFEYLP